MRWTGLAAGVCAALALAMPPARARAQTYGVAGGALLQRYTFADPEAAGLKSFDLFTAPFAAALPLGSSAVLEVSGAYAEGTLTGSGGEAKRSGFTDTDIGLTVTLGAQRMVLTAAATLPTGRSTQTFAEATVAGVVAAELLPFAITTWGTGGSTGGDVALAFQAGRVGLGLSGSYRRARTFQPLEGDAFTYRPGDQIRVRLALDADVSESGTLSVLLGFQHFGDDLQDGANLFRSGRRLEGVISYAFAFGRRGGAQLYGGIYHREHGRLLAETPSLEGASDSPSQQLFVAGLDLRLPAGRATFLPDGEIRVFRSQDGVGQGWVAGAGGALELRVAGRRFGRRLVLAPSGRVRIGHVIAREGAETDLTGWEAGLIVRIGGGR